VQLLVSVRSADEARAALAGGADIVDAKEPAAGALGAVSPEVLAEIRTVVPDDVPLSAALGDVASVEDTAAAFAGVRARLRFVKLGFRGVGDGPGVERLLGTAVKLAAGLPGRPGVIAVAYADWSRVGSLAPGGFPAIVGRAGAQGLLIDTANKGEGTLRDFFPVEALRALGGSLSQDNLRFALAGSLTGSDVHLVLAAGADIMGVRGAVTISGRNGTVTEELVSALAALVKPGAGLAIPPFPEPRPAVRSLR
jgi:(5-formylfuran-3-yl)methyl phosphate synthase